MSEALFSRAAGGRHDARSAGTEPATRVHEGVVAVMREKGIGLAGREPRLLTDELARWADVVVTMGCGDACPVIPGKRYLEWEQRDPKDLALAEVRFIRDEIEARVGDLIQSLDRGSI